MKITKVIFSILLFFSVLTFPFWVKAEECTDIGNLNDKIKCLSDQVGRLSEQSKTLSNQIAQFNAQIYLTTLKIAQTEEKIALLGGRIDQLEISLSSLSNAFASRAVETYKRSRAGDSFFLLISSPNLTQAVTAFRYLQKIQEADRDLLQRLQSAQTNYKGQKTEQEALQKQLDQQKVTLANQKAEKAQLLTITQNDEVKYQQLLAQARAELAVTLGQGKETFLRDVSEGERIGTIIYGRSGCSTGTHLHFQVDKDGNYQDPNDYLKSGVSWSYSDDYDVGYFGNINPHGTWNWPLDEPIKINQGFGSHPYAKVAYPYTGGVHTGIDMDSSNKLVKAVKAGKLYGGSYQCTGQLAGTLLYAKVDQGDGITTWYLHMTPQ